MILIIEIAHLFSLWMLIFQFSKTFVTCEWITTGKRRRMSTMSVVLFFNISGMVRKEYSALFQGFGRARRGFWQWLRWLAPWGRRSSGQTRGKTRSLRRFPGTLGRFSPVNNRFVIATQPGPVTGVASHVNYPHIQKLDNSDTRALKIKILYWKLYLFNCIEFKNLIKLNARVREFKNLERLHSNVWGMEIIVHLKFKQKWPLIDKTWFTKTVNSSKRNRKNSITNT